MNCAECGFDNPDPMKFCVQCGHSLSITCHGCGSRMLATYRFCGECGANLREGAGAEPAQVVAAPLPSAPATAAPVAVEPQRPARSGPMEGERKQVTVMYCDLVSSRPEGASLSPDLLHNLLSRFFELAQSEIQHFGGAINRYLEKGFMALFGAATAYEDHPLRGVLAARGLLTRLATQGEELEKLAPYGWTAKLGIATGSVVVGGSSEMAVGEATSIASALKERAGAGQILIDTATARLTAGQVEATELDRFELADQSVTSFEIQRQSATVGLSGFSAGNLSRFVGRDHELRALEQVKEQAMEGRGQVAGIVGDAGSGKSRLLHEFYRRTFRGRQVSYLRGQCVSYGAGVPYLPLIDMIRKASRISDDDDGAEITRKLRLSLQSLGTDIEASLPFLLRLLGVDAGTEELHKMEPQAIQTRTFAAMQRLLLDAAAGSLVVVEIEDLHWIDETSAEFLDGLIELMTVSPLLLLLTYRAGYKPRWIEKSYATQIAMRPLSEENSRALITELLTGGDQELDPLLLEKAEGNPFFLEELARALALQSEAGDGSAGVPDTIQGILLARIDGLPEMEKKLLRTASVLGREISPELLQTIWDGPGSVAELLESLQRRELVYKERREDRSVYLFKHGLTQEVTYESLLVGPRQALHLRVAESLEEEYAGRLEDVLDRLTYHYPAAGDSAKTVHYLKVFADRAAQNFAHAEAAKALREALKHAPGLPEEERDRKYVELLLQLAESLLPLAEFPETLSLFTEGREVMEGIGDQALACRYYFWLAHTYTYLGLPEETRDFARRSIEAAKACDDEVTEGQACYVLGRDGFWSGQFAEGIQSSLRAVILLERAGEPWWQGQSYWVAGFNHYVLGQFDEAIDAMERALHLGETLDDHRLDPSWSLGYIYAALGEVETGIEQCKRSIERSRDPLNSAVSQGFLGYALLEKGDLEAATENLEAASSLMQQAGMQQLEGWFEAFLCEACRRAGDLEKATQWGRSGLEASENAKFSFGMELSRRALGKTAATAERYSEAVELLRDAVRGFETLEAPFELGRTKMALADALRAAGDPDAAATELGQARSLFEECSVPAYVERATRLEATWG